MEGFYPTCHKTTFPRLQGEQYDWYRQMSWSPNPMSRHKTIIIIKMVFLIKYTHAITPYINIIISYFNTTYFIPRKPFFIHKNPHKLWDCKGWMSIIELDCNLHVKTTKKLNLYFNDGTLASYSAIEGY